MTTPDVYVVDPGQGAPLIDARRLFDLLGECLYEDDEVTKGEAPEGAVLAEGVINTFAFHPDRLEAHRDEVRQMLMNLPVGFRPIEQGGGGGHSFLAACEDSNGVLWGQHASIEQLMCLGIALGYVTVLLPREMWDALPGGMPYFTVNVGEA